MSADNDISMLMNVEEPELLLERAHPFMGLMTQYQCAMLELKTKLDVLNAELSLENDRNPIESIVCRLKKPVSIMSKLRSRGCEMTIENIEKRVRDVAGIRVICSFVNDIYMLAEKLCSQDDVRLIDSKDYIKNPKPNGYRSLHLIIEIPIFLSNETKPMLVEVQLRTTAMVFWASIEHKIKYKKNISDGDAVAERLRQCAEEISRIDEQMQSIRDEVESMQNTDI